MGLKEGLLREGLDRMVRGRLRGVWCRGALPAGPLVWASSHHSWWDPFVAAAVLRAAGRRAALVMDDDSLAAFGFLRGLGVVGASESRAALGLLRAGRVLVTYPEGALLPVGPPGPLARGAAWLAAHSGASMVAVGIRVAMRGHEAPEAYVAIEPIRCGGRVPEDTERLAETLGSVLAELDRLLAGTEPRTPLPGFRRVVAGRRSWDERLSRLPFVGRS